MKKKIIFLIMLCVLPFISVQALEETKFEKLINDSVSSDKLVDGSSFLVGNSVSASNTVKGIGILAGNKVDFKGVHDYSIAFGNIINLSGTIVNDGFIFGNVVTFDETFKGSRDLTIFANEVIINGNIDRDVIIFANKVIINSTIRGDIEIKAGSIELKDNAKVEGTLTHNQDSKNEISKLATIGEIKTSNSINIKSTFQDILVSNLYNLLGMLLVFLAVAFILPKLLNKITKKDLTLFKAISIMGYGALTLVLLPIIFFLLVSLGVGIPLALILLTMYIVTICVANMFSGYLLGNVIWTKGFKKEHNTYIEGLIGISIIYILLAIPFINTFIMIFSLLIGVGMVTKLFKKD